MRTPPVLAATVLAALALGGCGSGGEGRHELDVVVGDATNTTVGQYIRAGGTTVGQITSIDPVDGGRRVRLGLELDDRAWPLPQGSTFELRWGGTASFDNRYVNLTLGPAGRPPIADGAMLPTGDFRTPVELDTLLTAFTPAVRTDLRAFFTDAGATLTQAKTGLRRTLTKAPAALDETRHVLSDLAADQPALDVLLRQGDTSVRAVQEADPGLRRLLSGMSQTFAAVARRQSELRTTLDATPATFANVRRTLRRADGTLTSAAELTDRLAPGVTQLRRIASPLNRVLGTVERVGPDARSTVGTLRRAAPSLNPLLKQLTADLPKLGSIGRQATTELRCLRPYTPELAALFSTWAAFQSNSDGRDKFFRANVIVPAGLSNNVTPYDSATATKLFPGLTYGNPLPPGAVAGQPWFQPECGVTADGLNPEKDQESRTR